MLAEVEWATKELQATLPFVNDPTLRPRVESLARGAATVAASFRLGVGGRPDIADDLAGLLSAARTLRVPAEDPDLGRTNTLLSLRSAKGLIVAALEDALDAAQVLGLRPRRPALIRELPTEVPRSGNEAVLRGIAARLDEVVERLDALENAKMLRTDFAPQTGLLDFYVEAMRVEVDVAKMQLEASDEKADFGALTRAIELMSELTGDFVTTVRAWVGRVSDTVVQLAVEISKKVRRVAVGARTAAKQIIRKLRPRAAPAAEQTQSPGEEGRGMLTTNLERTLHRALSLANERRHEYATIEHLLLSLTEDEDAIPVFLACSVDLGRLRRDLLSYVDNELANLVAADSNDAKPTASFQRVLQRSAIHVRSSGRDEVNGANVLVAMFAERESHAVFLLKEHDVTRFDAVNFISHGVSKNSSRPASERAPSPYDNIRRDAIIRILNELTRASSSSSQDGQTWDVKARARLLMGAGQAAFILEEYDLARVSFEQALSLFRQIEDPQGVASCVKGLADIDQLTSRSG
jgi:hypothetical protein